MACCSICGSAVIACGFRRPGILSSLDPDKRGYLWSCRKCLPLAEARWKHATRPDIASAQTEQPQRRGGGGVSAKAPDPKQGEMF